MGAVLFCARIRGGVLPAWQKGRAGRQSLTRTPLWTGAPQAERFPETDGGKARQGLCRHGRGVCHEGRPCGPPPYGATQLSAAPASPKRRLRGRGANGPAARPSRRAQGRPDRRRDTQGGGRLWAGRLVVGVPPAGGAPPRRGPGRGTGGSPAIVAGCGQLPYAPLGGIREPGRRAYKKPDKSGGFCQALSLCGFFRGAAFPLEGGRVRPPRPRPWRSGRTGWCRARRGRRGRRPRRRPRRRGPGPGRRRARRPGTGRRGGS